MQTIEIENEVRKQRGLKIAKNCKIKKTEEGWLVPSQSGMGLYLVISDGYHSQCSCPDYELRHQPCKHCFAVEFIITKTTDSEGNVTIEKSMRITYPQNWTAYNKAQTHEKDLFMRLLADLCGNIDNPDYQFGRPKMAFGEMVFASALKVYTGFSCRRFISDMRQAHEEGFVDSICCYSSISNYMRNEELTSILEKLIEISSLPLKGCEAKFAVDSTGFATIQYKRWFDAKYGKDMDKRIWLKAHAICGVKTNIITGIKVTDAYANDCPILPELVNKTGKNFGIFEVLADKAYLSRKNFKLVNEYDALPYIPFKKNTKRTSKGCRLWRKMWLYFEYNRERFLDHYHARSNIETTFSMIKAKFGTKVRSKDKTAQINEILLKVLCHNICVIIQEMHELGIQPNFCLKSEEDV